MSSHDVSRLLARGVITIRKLRQIMEHDAGADGIDSMLEFSPQEMEACGIKRKRDNLHQVVELDEALSHMLENPKYIGVAAVKAAKKTVDAAYVKEGGGSARVEDGDNGEEKEATKDSGSSEGESIDGEESDGSLLDSDSDSDPGSDSNSEFEEDSDADSDSDHE